MLARGLMLSRVRGEETLQASKDSGGPEARMR